MHPYRIYTVHAIRTFTCSSISGEICMVMTFVAAVAVVSLVRMRYLTGVGKNEKFSLIANIYEG